jgi:hypothetical protein
MAKTRHGQEDMARTSPAMMNIMQLAFALGLHGCHDYKH